MRNRQLQDFEDEPILSQCLVNDVLESSGENSQIPAYHGIVFDVVGMVADLEVTALSFLARVDEITDWAADVYVAEGDWRLTLSNPAVWTHVAHVDDAVANGGWVYIPDTAFKPVHFSKLQRKSIYIAMNGPWVHSNADALSKPGEVYRREDDMVLYTGVGLDERFPSDYNRTTYPQFAGALYYRQPTDCQEGTVATQVDLQYLMAGSEDPVFVIRVKEVLNDLVRNTMMDVKPFAGWIKDRGLIVSQPPQIDTFAYDNDGRTNNCPENWKSECPRNVLGPRLFFQHSEGLSPGALEYEIYRFADSLADLLGKRLNTNEVAYVGVLPVVSEFSFTMDGVPMDKNLFNQNNQKFLEKAATEFFADAILQQDPYLKVLDTQIEGHGAPSATPKERRLLRHLQTTTELGSMQYYGSMMGAQPRYLPLTAFPFALREAASDDSFRKAIQIKASVTADTEESGLSPNEYFGNLSNMTAAFDPDLVEAGTLEDDSSSFNILPYIVVGLIVLALILAMKFVCQHFEQIKINLHSLKRKKMIEERKAEKEKREAKREKVRESRASIPSEISLDIGTDDHKEQPRPKCPRRAKSSGEIEPHPGNREVRRAHSSDEVSGMAFSPRKNRRSKVADTPDLNASMDLADLTSPDSPSKREGRSSLQSSVRKPGAFHSSCSESPRRSVKQAKSSEGAPTFGREGPRMGVRRSKSFEAIDLPDAARRSGRRRTKSGDGRDLLPQSPRRTSSREKLGGSSQMLRMKSSQGRHSRSSSRSESRRSERKSVNPDQNLLGDS